MFHSNIAKCLLTALCVTGFVIIAYFVTQGAALSFDTTVQTTVFSLRTEWLTKFLIPLTYSGNWQFVVTICVALLIIPQTRRPYGVPMTVSAVLSVSFYEMLKFVFERPRPDIAMRLIDEVGYSFPSGHTLTSLIFWGTAIFLFRSYARIPETIHEEGFDFPRITKKSTVNLLTLVIGAYILLMGFSRIYVGVHFATDVVGSWCLGICILTVLHTSYFPSLLPKHRE